MPRLAPPAVVLAVLAAAGVAPRSARAEPPVQVHVDLHLPGRGPAAEAPPPLPPPPPHHHGPDHHVEPPPPHDHHADRGHPHRHPHPGPRHGRDAFHVPPDRIPRPGLCRVWFDDLPPDRQPPPMACERAHHAARRHGGRVIWAEAGGAPAEGRVASAWYGGADFSGVPPDRLPPPGSCRVWLEGVPPDRQPPPGPCDRAERDARRTGGRLLYMPGP